MENIKMRHIYKGNCSTCGCDVNDCLDMFEIGFVNNETNKLNKLKLCDKCIDDLFSKALKAITYTNSRIKNKTDMTIINNRSWKSHKDKIKEHPEKSQSKEESEWDKVLKEMEEDD